MKSAKKSKSDLSDQQTDDSDVLFWLNKSGFPLDSFTWDRMWNHVEKIHPEGSTVCRNIKNSSLKPVPIPQVPLNFPRSISIPDRIDAVQKYMQDLQYNHTGTQFFEIRKYRPISGLMDVARDMIKESLPIKCLEAIVLGIYLTNGLAGVERFPIGFKSSFNGSTHRHVVLGLFYAGKFGTIGMSRRHDLMYKPLIFKSLSELIFDYHESYKKYLHTVKKTKIGLPVPHDQHSFEQISWKGLVISSVAMTRAEMQRDIEKHSKEIRAQVKVTPPNAGSPRKSPGSPKKEKSRASFSKDRTQSDLRPGESADEEGNHSGNYQIRI